MVNKRENRKKNHESKDNTASKFMNLELTGIHLDITDDIRNYYNKKLHRIEFASNYIIDLLFKLIKESYHMKNWIYFLFTFSITLTLIILLSISIGMIPPIGNFLSPFHGFWQNAFYKEMPSEKELDFKGLKKKVTVLFDDRFIPHIFAECDHDLYFTLGYLTARDRLWQMEIQVMSVSGRLSEILGEKTLKYDLYYIKNMSIVMDLMVIFHTVKIVLLGRGSR